MNPLYTLSNELSTHFVITFILLLLQKDYIEPIDFALNLCYNGFTTQKGEILCTKELKN